MGQASIPSQASIAVSWADDDGPQFGGVADLRWETADANANYMSLELPAGGAVDVPVFAIGIGLDDVDLGVFNGFTEPFLGAMDADRDSYVGFHYSGDDVAVLRMVLAGGTVRNHTIPDVASSTLAVLGAAQTFSGEKTFGTARLRVTGSSVPSGGNSIELTHDGTDGQILVYDRTGAQYHDLKLGSGLTSRADNVITIGAVAPGTGTTCLIFGDGTAPSSMAANTAGLYANDSGGTVEMYAIDEAGASSILSPHPSDFLDTVSADHPYPWAYSSEHAYLGKKIQVDMAGAVAEIEKLSGKTFVTVTDIPKRDWYADQDAKKEVRKKEIVKAKAMVAALDDQISKSTTEAERDALANEKSLIEVPPAFKLKHPPAWVQARGVAKKA